MHRLRVQQSAVKASLALAMAVATSACSAAGEEQAAEPSTTTIPIAAPIPTGPFTINVASATVDGNAMRVSGTTNLPDGSKLAVYVERAHTFPNPDDFAGYRQASASTSVSRGAFNTSFEIDSDKDWIATIASLVDNPYTYGPLISVSDSLSVCVEFATVRDGEPQQPEAVLSVVGRQGENLRTSPQVQEFGSNFPPPSYDLVADGPLVAYPSKASSELSKAQGNSVRVDSGLASGC
jgi:hypothetical protein